MEAFVRRLFSDAEYRRKFLADPIATSRGASLSAAERQTVLRVSSTLAAALVALQAGKGLSMANGQLLWV